MVEVVLAVGMSGYIGFGGPINRPFAPMNRRLSVCSSMLRMYAPSIFR